MFPNLKSQDSGVPNISMQWFWDALHRERRCKTITEWADRYRRLSPESSAEPGRWHTDRAPYQREVMDVLSSNEYPMVIWMSSTQVGKTELLNNLVGFHMSEDPCPILLVEPTLEIAGVFDQTRLEPMIRDTPRLRQFVKLHTFKFEEVSFDEQVRESKGKQKHFPGGSLYMVGSNSVAGLASRPIRIFIGDDVDRWVQAAGHEGDQIVLGQKRTTTFWNRKTVLFSTPSTEALSRINKHFLMSDQRFYHVPCPHCHEMQVLNWKNLIWEKDTTRAHLPDTAHFVCVANSCRIEEASKIWMLGNGQWIAKHPNVKGIAGFWIWEAYSPWKRWSEIVVDFLQAKTKGGESMKAFKNTSLAEVYVEEGDAPEWEIIQKRALQYMQDDVPNEVLFLTAGCDVQNDRVEIQILGWGHMEECWVIAHKVIYGDMETQEMHDAIDNVLLAPFPQPSQERNLFITLAMMDTGGGTKTNAAYGYCRTRKYCRAVRGSSVVGAPPVGRPHKRDLKPDGTSAKKSVEVWTLGVSTIKEEIYSRLNLDKFEGPRTIHFPYDLDDEFYKQLTAEKMSTKYINGFPKKVWTKNRHRNEALDCMGYGRAAAILVGIERINWASVPNPRKVIPITSESVQITDAEKDTDPNDKKLLLQPIPDKPPVSPLPQSRNPYVAITSRQRRIRNPGIQRSPDSW